MASPAVFLWCWTTGDHPVYSSVDGSAWSLFLQNGFPNDGAVSFFWLDENSSNQNGIYYDTSTGQGMFWTQDQGAHWHAFLSEPAVNPRHVAAILPSGRLLEVVAAGGGGNLQVAYSDNAGSTWTLTGVLPNQTSQMLVGTSAARSGLRFYRLSNGTVVLFAADSRFNINQLRAWYSTDNGLTWATGLSVHMGTDTSNPISTCYHNTPLGDVLMVSYSAGAGTTAQGTVVYRSTDGINWQGVFSDVGVKYGTYLGGQQSVNPTSLFSMNNPGFMTDGTWLLYVEFQKDSFADYDFAIYRSYDNGVTWVPDAVSASIPTNNFSAGAPSNVCTGSDLLGNTYGYNFATVQPGMYKSTDAGKTWASFRVTQNATPYAYGAVFSFATPGSSRGFRRRQDRGLPATPGSQSYAKINLARGHLWR